MNGTIVDRSLNINRNEKKLKVLDPMSEIVRQRQEYYKHTIGFFFDEFSMAGLNMLGHINGRAKTFFNKGQCQHKLLGGIPINVFFGDLKQLTSVLDRAPWLPTAAQNLTVLKNEG